MWTYTPIPSSDEIYHSGKKGMKWGYNDGHRNGNRTAAEDQNTYVDTNITYKEKPNGNRTAAEDQNTYVDTNITYKEKPILTYKKKPDKDEAIKDMIYDINSRSSLLDYVNKKSKLSRKQKAYMSAIISNTTFHHNGQITFNNTRVVTLDKKEKKGVFRNLTDWLRGK